MEHDRLVDPLKTLVIAALGFDEKSIVRCITRNDPTSIDKVVLFQPSTGDEYSRKRLEEAWNNLRKVIEEYAGIRIEKRQVNPTIIIDVIKEVRRLITSWGGNRIVICGGSGMRALAIALVIATFTLPPEDKNKVVIDIDLESLDKYVRIRLSDVDRLKLTDNEEKVVEAVARLGEASVADISEYTGLPKSTVSRIAKRLAEWGYLERVGKGVYRMRLKPTTQ